MTRIFFLFLVQSSSLTSSLLNNKPHAALLSLPLSSLFLITFLHFLPSHIISQRFQFPSVNCTVPNLTPRFTFASLSTSLLSHFPFLIFTSLFSLLLRSRPVFSPPSTDLYSASFSLPFLTLFFFLHSHPFPFHSRLSLQLLLSPSQDTREHAVMKCLIAPSSPPPSE